eukprot:3693069-Prymnesium_polylepis.1
MACPDALRFSIFCDITPLGWEPHPPFYWNLLLTLQRAGPWPGTRRFDNPRLKPARNAKVNPSALARWPGTHRRSASCH